MSWLSRFWAYLEAAGLYWWAALAVFTAIERYAERAFPEFWKRRVDPWVIPVRRKQVLIAFALIAFVIGNFRAWDEERAAKLRALAGDTSPRDPIGIYLSGIRVGQIAPGLAGNPAFDPATNIIRFNIISASRELDLTQELEFREWKMLCTGNISGGGHIGAMQIVSYENFVCKIQGHR